MSKQYRIRWKQDDETRLKKAVKNFNAKRTRLIKKDPTIKEVLPEKVTLKELKDLIQTRNDLNREIKSLERFTKTNKGKTKRGKPKAQPHDIVTIPGNKYNVKITRWQLNEMVRSKPIIDKKRQERHDQLSNLEMTSRGKKLGYKKGDFGMGKLDMHELKPINLFTEAMTRSDVRKKFKVIRKERQSNYWTDRELALKENYIKSITENFNPNDVKDIVEHIKGMDYDDFYLTFQAEGGNFELSYPPNKEQEDEYINALKSTWLPEHEEKEEVETSNKVKPNESKVNPQKTSKKENKKKKSKS